MMSVHLLFDELETPINRHDGLVPILLQQHRSHQFVDVGVIVQSGEFALHALVLLLLRFKLLTSVDETFEVCEEVLASVCWSCGDD